MEELVYEILKKHGIDDENLANALAEIVPLLEEEAVRKRENDIKMSAYMRGIRE